MVEPRRADFVAGDRALKTGEIYIGRGCTKAGLPKSKWHNPFKIREGRQEAIERYATWLDKQPRLLKSLPSLTNMTLVCHCRPGLACHGDVLVDRWRKHTSGSAPATRPQWARGNTVWKFVTALRGSRAPLQIEEWRRLWPHAPGSEPCLDLPSQLIWHAYSGPEGPEALAQRLMRRSPTLATCLLEVEPTSNTEFDWIADSVYAKMVKWASTGAIRAIVAHVPEMDGTAESEARLRRMLLIAMVAVHHGNSRIFICWNMEDEAPRLQDSEQILTACETMGIHLQGCCTCSLGDTHGVRKIMCTNLAADMMTECRADTKCRTSTKLMWTQTLQQWVVDKLCDYLKYPTDHAGLPKLEAEIFAQGHSVPTVTPYPKTLVSDWSEQPRDGIWKAGFPPPEPPGELGMGHARKASFPPPTCPKPSSKPIARPLVVREDHRIRHFRDGGGLPSQGNWAPEDRRPPRLLQLGSKLDAMVEKHGLRHKLTATYMEKAGNLFSDEVLHIARCAIAEECGVSM